jgi:hypothetical protein
LGGERDEAEAESGGLAVEVWLLYIAGAVLLAGEVGFIIRGAGGDHVVEDAGEFVGGGGDGLGCAELGAFAAEEVADGGVAATGGVGGHAQGVGGAGGHLAGARLQLLVAGDAVVRTQARPGAKVLGAFESPQIGPVSEKNRWAVSALVPGSAVRSTPRMR